ncbi:MAG TPA: peptidyl-prolyl cis-trans isomerase [Gemmataceae bacterium]|jgi:parvulin-like peptidyl-prolyl isomerase
MRTSAGSGGRRVVAAGVLGFGLAGCVSPGTTPVVRDAARPAADAILADAPALLPQVPVTSTTATRGQSGGDVQPVAGTTAGNSAQVAVRLRATVNGIPILDDEVREAMAQYVGELIQAPEAVRPQLQQQIYERELQRLIEREMVLEEAVRRIKDAGKDQVMKEFQKEAAKEADKQLRAVKAAVKAKSDDEFKAMLQAQGLTVGGLRRQYERNFMMMEYVRNLVYPVVNRISLQQVRDYYEQHPAEFTTEDAVTWQDLFIDASRFPTPAAARQFAEQVRALAAAGQDFPALVKQYDCGDSHLRNGAGLGRKHGEIVPQQVEPAVWALKPGEVGPVIDLGFGLHIVKVVDRQYAGPKPFDVACQADIRKKLQAQIADREFKRIVDELKKKATVVVYQ